MCRFYGRGLNRYYRLCYRKGKRRGQHIWFQEGRADIRRPMSGGRCVPLRKVPRGKQKTLFPDLENGQKKQA